MISKAAGELVRVRDEEVRLRVGPIELEIQVSELVRRRLQTRIGETVELHTLLYLANDRTRSVPKMIGFQSEVEIEFFHLFCTVDGIGVKTALKAMVRSVRDIADMVQRQDAKGLATLPGISAASAERIVAKLRRKVTHFALMVEHDGEPPELPVGGDLLADAFQCLLSVGYNETDARATLDRVLVPGKKYKDVADVLQAIYAQQG